MARVLWWGRFNLDYSRNRIISTLLRMLGWEIETFRPVSSRFGGLEAYLRNLKRPDLIWVPCFRQRDMASALFWKKKWGVPLIFEPLTSAYEKAVYERKKWPPQSPGAERKRRWERRLFSRADAVVLETPAYAEFVHREMGIPRDRLEVLYQGAFMDFFRPMAFPPLEPPYEIIFFGSFQPSMGAPVIADAARLTLDLPCRWVLIGEGEEKREALQRARGLTNVLFESWVPYDALPKRLARAHILLGIFGTTYKTDMVIPNKVFESMAMGRPLITQRARSYEQTLGGSGTIGWVPRGSAEGLAEKAREWIGRPRELEERGGETRRLFEEHFSFDKLKGMLEGILARHV